MLIAFYVVGGVAMLALVSWRMQIAHRDDDSYFVHRRRRRQRFDIDHDERQE